jgi:hypothetical protein
MRGDPVENIRNCSESALDLLFFKPGEDAIPKIRRHFNVARVPEIDRSFSFKLPQHKGAVRTAGSVADRRRGCTVVQIPVEIALEG